MSDPTENNTPDQMVNDPASQLFASLADFYRDNGLYPEAIAICQAGLESQPDNIEGRLVMAKCLLATKQYALARTEAAKVLSVQSENSEAKKILSQADSAGPDAQPPAAPPVKAEKEAMPEPVTPAISKPEPVVPEPAAKAEEPVPAPVKMPELQPKEIPASPLPLMAKREEPQPAVPPKTEEKPVQTTPVPEEVKEKPAVPPKATKQPSEETVEWQAGFGKIMNDLVQTPQVKACMLVDENGYSVADAVSRTGQSLSEDSAALSANIFKTAHEALKKIKLGELERIVIETGDEKLFLRQAGKMVLMISADPSAKVGLVMVNSKRAAEQAENLAKKEPGG